MLKHNRTKAGLSQWELAAKSGLSIRTVRRAEKGGTVSAGSWSRINEVLDKETNQELVLHHKKRMNWLHEYLPIHFPSTAPNGFNNSVTVDRMEDGYVILAPEKPWVIGIDGYIMNINNNEQIDFTTLEYSNLEPSMFIWQDLGMAVAQAACNAHQTIASKRFLEKMTREEFAALDLKISGRTKLMIAFEKAGYPGKAKERNRLEKEFDLLIETMLPDQAADTLIKEIGNIA